MDSRRDHYQNLVDRIREFALKQVNKSDFEFHMDTTNIPMDDFLPPDIRQHVYFIIKEAITNSLKHSDGHCIDLTIRQERNNLLVHIQDDGTVKRPINREGLGLSNMRMRAGKMNAELWVSQEHGFEVTCNIPLAKIRR